MWQRRIRFFFGWLNSNIGGDWTSSSVCDHWRYICDHWSQGGFLSTVLLCFDQHYEWPSPHHHQNHGKLNLSYEKVVIIKIDVEGHECKALAKEVPSKSPIFDILTKLLIININNSFGKRSPIALLFYLFIGNITINISNRSWISPWANLSPTFLWNGPISGLTGISKLFEGKYVLIELMKQ